MDYAENCRAGADAQRQRDDRNQSKTRSLDQHARAVTYVLPECTHHTPSPEPAYVRYA